MAAAENEPEQGEEVEVTEVVRAAPAVEHVRATVNVQIGDVRIKTAVPVVKGLTGMRHLLPVLRAFSDAIGHVAVEKSAAGGKPLSCKAGCGACCQQLVPVMEPEAHALAVLVAGMEEERRRVILERFAKARERLREGDLLQKSGALDGPVEECAKLGMDYFRLGIACPFLEEESCSIYADRPLVCREYLVSSDAVHCATPETRRVVAIEHAASMSAAVLKSLSVERPRRVALILALEWAAAHPEEVGDKTGPEHLQTVLGHLTGGGKSAAKPS